MDISLNSDIYITRGFNHREEVAFSSVYTKLYDELNGYAKRIFINHDMNHEDVVQDIFIELWGSTKKFDSISHIKNFIYTCIKNRHKDYLKHKMVVDNYTEYISLIDDYHTSKMVEVEVYSLLSAANRVLKRDNLEILRLTLEEYDVKEIAEKMGKSIFTIHHKKKSTINTLKDILYKYING